MAGRPPKPNAIKRLTGSRHVNPDEPVIAPGAPECPSYLHDLARQTWFAVCAILNEMRVITRADENVVARYCTIFCRWREAEESLEKDGMVITSPNGYPIQNPYLAIANKSSEQLDRLDTKLGLSPSDRNRLHVMPTVKDDPMDDFLAGAG